MRTIARLLIPVVLMAAACGGNSKVPTAPSAISADPGTGVAGREPNSAETALTLENIAASLTSEINVSFIGAMQEGMPSGLKDSQPNPLQRLLRDSFDAFIGVRVHAQAFTRNCSRRGNVQIRYFGSTTGRSAALSNTPVAFSGCTFRAGTRDVSFTAELRGTGTWRADQPASPVRIQGDVGVDGLGNVPIDIETGIFPTGTVGGIRVGAPDTPPTANPPGTVGPTPAKINVTGTWGINGQAALSLQQIGNVLIGQFVMPDLPATGLITIVENTLSGTVRGSEVSFEGILTMRIGDPAGWMTLTSRIGGTFQASDSALSGRLASRATSECTGEMAVVCPPPIEDDSAVTLVRVSAPAPTQATLLDVSGKWKQGAFTYDLRQAAGGAISGSITGANVVEQRVEGRNVNNQVTLTSHIMTRRGGSDWSFTQTYDHRFEMSVYDSSAMGGLVMTTYVDRCVTTGSVVCDPNRSEQRTGTALFMR